MKVKYIGNGSFSSKGHRFETGESYDLLPDTFSYMTSTFKTIFEVLSEDKVVEIKEPVEEEPEVVAEKPKVEEPKVEEPKRKRAKKNTVSEKE